jgi:hypothetical protein
MKIMNGLNWKTTAAGAAFVASTCGALLADPAMAPLIAPYKGYLVMGAAIAGFAAHALAKDGDVTGGTRPQ